MKEYISIHKIDESQKISVLLFIDKEPVFGIGKKINRIDKNAYMNGYNWAAFINYYLRQTNHELIDGLDSDPEAGMYCADYELNDRNMQKAEKLKEEIISLIESPNIIFQFIKENAKAIEWD